MEKPSGIIASLRRAFEPDIGRAADIMLRVGLRQRAALAYPGKEHEKKAAHCADHRHGHRHAPRR